MRRQVDRMRPGKRTVPLADRGPHRFHNDRVSHGYSSVDLLGSYADRMQWAPRPAETAAAAAGALIAAVLAVTSDVAGRLLFGIGALCLASLVVTDLMLRPRLRADSTTLEVRTLAVRRRLPWSAVEQVRVDEHSRYGLLTRTLEVDTGDSLVVLGRRSLGADPRDVAEALRQLRTEPFR
jgi:hypothetical protein